MAENIMAMVGLRRGLIEGTETADVLHEAIAKYATAQLYKSTARTLTRLRRDVVGLLAREFLPYATEVGKASARPVLDAMGGTKLVEKGNAVRGRVLQGLQTYHKNNLLAFRAALNQEVGTLGGEIEAAFARGARDGVARKQLIDDLVASHKGEMARLADVRVEIESKADALADAERRLGEAGKRTQREAKRNVAKASKELTAAKGKLGTAKDFYGRFETRIQGHVRDTIRREAETAQTAAFRQAGYSEFTWIAVNGEAACPSCSALHGTKLKGNEANTMGPGSRDTYCGSSCMCVLVPDDYARGNESLTKPLRRPPRPPRGEDVSAGRPGMAPIKLGGANARLAKRAVKRARAATPAKFVPAKTVAEAEAWAKSHGLSDTVSYAGLDVRTANSINRGLDDMAARFNLPQMEGLETAKIPAWGRSVLDRETGRYTMKFHPLITGERGNTFLGGNVADGYKSGYFPRIAGDAYGEATARHEATHMIFRESVSDPALVKTVKGIRGRWLKATNKLARQGKMQELAESGLDISAYARTSVDEFAAEAVVDATMGINPSPFAREVLDVLTKATGAGR